MTDRETSGAETFTTGDASTQALLQKIDRVARSALPVLLQGETGTGKELLARRVHCASPRVRGPFVALNCGAISPTLLTSALFGHVRGAFTGAHADSRGVFEAAAGGTLFLDEVGELSPEAQASLLRVLETKTVAKIGSHDAVRFDVRVVAATHRDLDRMAASGAFRPDLLYRLDTVLLTVPPLRERPNDIPLLATTFLDARRSSGETAALGIEADALERLLAYAWPGNVRELRNVVDYAALMTDGPLIRIADLPARAWAPVRRSPVEQASDQAPDYASRMRAAESEILRGALSLSGGRQTDAAKLLGMPLRTMKYRLSKLGFRRPSLDRHH